MTTTRRPWPDLTKLIERDARAAWMDAARAEREALNHHTLILSECAAKRASESVQTVEAIAADMLRRVK